mgnify:FL=1
MRARDVNLISVSSLAEPLRVCAKTHYRMKAQPGWARMSDDGALEMTFDSPQRAAAPGQALVLYDGDVVIGGGTIA